MYTTIISCQELAKHLSDEHWAVIDCRFDLAKPAWGFENYQQQHIPGAVYADLNRDLAAPVTPESGRHPLPDLGLFVQKLSAWGIGEGVQVVVYDTSGGSMAVRLWWMLKLLGHEAAAVLDGSFQRWVQSGLPLSSGLENRPYRAFPLHSIHQEMIASTADVERIRQDPQWRLVDARTPERFRAESEPIDVIAGHIPGAVNRFHGSNLSAEGTFKTAEQLEAEFQELLQGIPPERVVVYCGSGVTSIHHLVAMEAAGMKGARLYVGSWSEWICAPQRPRVP